MTKTTEAIGEILAAICTQVEMLPGKDFQSVFFLDDAAEAAIAFDVLIAHGFDAKIYPQDSGAKLYVTPPENTPHLDQNLRSALAYAHGLKRIKLDMDAITAQDDGGNSYRLSFSSPNKLSKDKRIVIDIAAESELVAHPVSTPDYQPPAPLRQSQKRQSKPITEDIFGAGPTVAQQALFQQYKKQERNRKPDGLARQLTNFLKGQATSTFFWVIAYTLILAGLYSIFVLSRAYLCPDFAVERKHVWYCSYDD
jgi:hypothetical protein